jgi:ferredoxin--NADP+ reductase
MAQWINGHVIENRQWSDRLHSLRVDAGIAPFEAGQFSRLGLPVDGEIISRPYSLVNAPDERPLDFYFSVVPGGRLSTRLAQLRPGDEVLVAPQASGLLTLNQLPPARHLHLLSSGTGVGPFLSIIKTDEPWQCFERVVLVHAVRMVADLTYRDAIQRVASGHPQQFVYIPFVSREPCDFALSGRLPQAITDGRLETCAGIAFGATDSQVMLCGNPEMLKDTVEALLARGLRKHKRRDPGQISVENYW